MHLILLGAPGSGKGTQAETIVREFKAQHIASGDLFRQEAAKGTDLGKLAKSYMDKGLLVPDEVTIKMILNRLSAPDCRQGFLLDGFPRTLEQAVALEQALAQSGRDIDWALYINVSTEELLRRLSGRWICRSCQAPYHMVTAPPSKAGHCDKCGGELYQRDDDKVETAQKRLEVYFRQTAPLIEHYRKADKLLEINGDQSIAAVGQQMLSKLKQTRTQKKGKKQAAK